MFWSQFHWEKGVSTLMPKTWVSASRNFWMSSL